MSRGSVTDRRVGVKEELDRARHRETAAREILQLISRSRDHETPVFDAILRRAADLCDADTAALIMATEADTHQRMVASYGSDPATVALYDRSEVPMDPDDSFAARAILTCKLVHVEDIMDTDQYRRGVEVAVSAVQDSGFRTILFVPLVTAAGGIGAINIHRKVVKPFTADEIALVETFAAQSVIAIENARQFRELQTRLEREKALAEILEIISQSREDAAPVFDAILRRVANLCGATAAALVMAKAGDTHERLVAALGLDPATAAFYERGEMRFDPEVSFAAEAILTGKVVHVDDLAETRAFRAGKGIDGSAVRDSGIRTIMFVPLLTPAGSIGSFNIFRKEVRPFTSADIAIVETFAAQAVIAIENARQFRELQDRLEREAATRDILEVISQSRDDDTPVFDMIARSAASLCGAAVCTFWRVEDGRIHYCASHGLYGDSYAETQLTPSIPLLGNTLTGQVVKSRAVVRIEDGMAESYLDHEWARRQGLQQLIGVPIIVGDGVWGSINLMWRVGRSPGDADVQLVESFASQAAIAIENARQFRALQEQLERDAATREILEVISQSRDDDRPVFDAILRNAARLCGAQMAGLLLGGRGDPCVQIAAEFGWSTEAIERLRAEPILMDREHSYTARSIIDGEVIHLPDLANSDLYLSGSRVTGVAVDDAGVRSMLLVPLLHENEAVGVIALDRLVPEPFAPSQVALIQSFASQAVIAIENVRQFKALEALNAELGDRVQSQVGEIERMGRLKRFLPAAVADTVVSSGSEKLLSSHRAILGVLFCDIRGFTAFCETAEPEETIEVLQTYHEEMGRLIGAHGAGVDHRMGDGIMVLFNDPLPCDDPAGAAVLLGMAMRDRMAELCAGWKRMGHRLGFGVGISLGYATVGMVGSSGRFDYTASGTAINLAERLCGEAQDGEILLSPRARHAVEDRFEVEARGEIQLKGIREPVEVFRLTGVASS